MVESVKVSARELDAMVTNTGESVASLSEHKPVLLIFLRHLGCVFCREALKDIAARKALSNVEDHDVVFVHMENSEIALPFFEKYNLAGSMHIEDTEQKLYQRFGLSRGTISQLFGFKTMLRGFSTGISLEQFGGASFGDAFQMPGIFVIYKHKVQGQYIHKTVSDRPNYQELLASCKV